MERSKVSRERLITRSDDGYFEDDKEPTTVSSDHPFSTLKLTTPEIVEFLKSPVVPGDHRRAFLDLLEYRYGRRFGNPWAFVEYAPAEILGLDFTACAQQPVRTTAGA